MLARIEAHLRDHELIAFNALLEHLIIAHYEREDDVRSAQPTTPTKTSPSDMLLGLCHLHAAARRAMRERNMPEAG